MSKAAIASAIRTLFDGSQDCQDAIAAAGFSVFYDNDGQEVGGETRRCRFYIDEMPDELIGMSNPGNALYRVENGAARVDLDVPSNKGEQEQWSVIDAIEAVFRGVTLTNPDIQFRAISTSKPTKAGARWRRTITIRFRADFRA